MERLSTHQFVVLGSAILLGTTFLPIGSLVGVSSGRDGWMSVLPGFLVAIPLGLFLISLISKYPKKNLLEITEIVLGKWIGKIIGILYIAITAYFGAILGGQGVDIFTRSILPLMPRFVFIGGGLILVLLLVWTGVEVFARFAEVVFPIVVLALVVTAIFIIPRFEQGELYPILGNGILPVFKGSLQVIPFAMEYLLYLAWLLPFLPQKKDDLQSMKKGIWKTVILVGLLDTMIVLIELMTFGSVEMARLTYGLLVLGKMIEVSRTLAGVESIFAMVWMGALATKVAAFFFAARWGLKTVFGWKSSGWSFALGGFFFLVPYIMVRGTDLTVEISFVDQYLILPFTLIWILLVWGADKWKKRAKSLNQGEGS